MIAYAKRNGPAALLSGIGGALAILLLAQVAKMVAQPLLIAPFGASCVLIFALPQSPLAQPRNVICGHLLSAFVGLATLSLLGHGVIACGVGVGLAIAAMQFSGTLHPPAGADPLVVIFTGAGWAFLGIPVLAGTVTLVLTAWLYHKHVSRRIYPIRD